MWERRGDRLSREFPVENGRKEQHGIARRVIDHNLVNPPRLSR
ncbi:MAG: hypothetical protein WCF90_01305 [Methanomicrobiales archaeon]